MSRTVIIIDRGVSQQVSEAEMVRAALDHLSGGPEKWAKGDFYVNKGSCAYGALELASRTMSTTVRGCYAIEAQLLKTLKDMHPELQADTIPDLNDDPAVTYEDILAAFEKTALHFEEKVQ